MLMALGHVARHIVCSLLAGELHAHNRVWILCVTGHVKTCAEKIG